MIILKVATQLAMYFQSCGLIQTTTTLKQLTAQK